MIYKEAFKSALEDFKIELEDLKTDSSGKPQKDLLKKRTQDLEKFFLSQETLEDADKFMLATVFAGIQVPKSILESLKESPTSWEALSKDIALTHAQHKILKKLTEEQVSWVISLGASV
jgi:predicted HAD superfamily hydrolase